MELVNIKLINRYGKLIFPTGKSCDYFLLLAATDFYFFSLLVTFFFLYLIFHFQSPCGGIESHRQSGPIQFLLSTFFMMQLGYLSCSTSSYIYGSLGSSFYERRRALGFRPIFHEAENLGLCSLLHQKAEIITKIFIYKPTLSIDFFMLIMDLKKKRLHRAKAVRCFF